MIKYTLLMLYIALVWASAILFVKTEETTVPPITIMAGRAIFAFLTIYVIALITRRKIMEAKSYAPKFLLLYNRDCGGVGRACVRAGVSYCGACIGARHSDSAIYVCCTGVFPKSGAV